MSRSIFIVLAKRKKKICSVHVTVYSVVYSPALVHHVLVFPWVIVGNVKAPMNFAPKGNFDV